MTATSLLVEKVARALSQWMNGARLPSPPNWERLQESTREVYREQAQAALHASHAEELRRELAQSATELVSAADLVSAFGLQGMASIFTDAAARNRALLAKLDVLPNATALYGYCPTCGAAGTTREKRPDGNDRCESGHTYPSRDALTAKLEGKP
jgi:hypothetical protein